MQSPALINDLAFARVQELRASAQRQYRRELPAPARLPIHARVGGWLIRLGVHLGGMEFLAQPQVSRGGAV